MIVSLLKDLIYWEQRPMISVMLETEVTKEIRIVFRQWQIMKEHQAPFPIIVEIVDGEIKFGAPDGVHTLERGDMITLVGWVPHDLEAIQDSVVRLTISKSDKTQRVQKAIDS